MITTLADHFLKLYKARTGSQVEGFSARAAESLTRHPWPGNVRELENAVARSLINVHSGKIETEHLELAEYSTAPLTENARPFEIMDDGTFDLKQARERVDRIYIGKVLALTGGNVSQAAKKLNISRNSLMELVGKYKLQ
jgi:DNA-binding NtrC family response regulator